MNFEAKKFKVTLIGDPFVGKTMISNALVNKPFTNNYIATIGASMIKIQVKDKETGESTWFYLWDTAGQEKYKSLAPVYFQDSDSIIIVYDVSNEDSFENVLAWYNLYHENISKLEDHKILIIGNKIDLRNDLENISDQEDSSKDLSNTPKFISTDRGQKLASSLNCDLLEISAKTGKNIDMIVEKLTEYSKLISTDKEESILTNAGKKSGCC